MFNRHTVETERTRSATGAGPDCSQCRCRAFSDHLRTAWTTPLFVTIVLIAVGSGCARDANGSPAVEASTATWSFLQNSYWYVPTPNLPALLSATSGSTTSHIPITDQTVFYIQTYQEGYFWGQVATEFTVAGESDTACFSMVGSVTPEGTVNLSFTPTDSSSSPTAGFGTMRLVGNQWTMENQMTSGTSQGSISHWAYMTQCISGQPCMESLPGTTQTIAQLLGGCT